MQSKLPRNWPWLRTAEPGPLPPCGQFEEGGIEPPGSAAIAPVHPANGNFNRNQNGGNLGSSLGSRAEMIAGGRPLRPCITSVLAQNPRARRGAIGRSGRPGSSPRRSAGIRCGNGGRHNTPPSASSDAARRRRRSVPAYVPLRFRYPRFETPSRRRFRIPACSTRSATERAKVGNPIGPGGLLPPETGRHAPPHKPVSALSSRPAWLPRPGGALRSGSAQSGLYAITRMLTHPRSILLKRRTGLTKAR